MSEMKKKYLYGAAVQGIQDFIFQTNKLKEIVGGSELVAQICTTAFGESLGKDTSDSKKMISDDPNWIVGAAGNIKYIFEDGETFRNIVLNFPRKVMTMAPGITISQAVVELEDNFGKAVEKLEENLRTQRNKAVRSQTLGLMAIARSRKTGLPGVDYDDDELIDEATKKKRSAETDQIVRFKLPKKSFGENVTLTKNNLARDMEDMTGDNRWIAVIHADGNGLGKVIQEIGHDEKKLKTFSQNLDEATTKAAQTAYAEVEKLKRFDETEMIPLRPIVLSGDDLTMICRADLAIPYTEAFLKAFEIKTQEFLKGKLTACAGIAFVKASYPFHYAADLAEELCGYAKKTAKKIDKDLAPSCLMFHKVQDSFINDFDAIIKKELMPQKEISYVAGPYYLKKQENSRTINDLSKEKDGLTDNSLKTHLRQWLELLYSNPEAANQKMKRTISITTETNVKEYKLESYTDLGTNSRLTIPFYDVLSLASIDIKTKNIEKK